MMGALQADRRGKSLAMGAFGERLRREREMRGVTLDEISESTKISRRHLESLEKEDFDSLPGGIFNRGFVRAYARFLGLDEEQAVADYAAVSSEQPAPPDQFPLEVHAKPDPKLNPRRSTLPLVLALLTLVAVLTIFWAKNKIRPQEKPPAAAVAAGSGSSSVSPSVTPAAEPASFTSTLPVTTTGAAAGGNNPPAGLPAATPTPENTFLIVVKAKGEAWVSLTADGRKVWEGILKADKQRSVRAAKRIELTTGNAGGLVVRLNGRAMGTLGNEGEVRTLTFTSAGLVQ
jgi:cytoskeleton protein RodZ